MASLAKPLVVGAIWRAALLRIGLVALLALSTAHSGASEFQGRVVGVLDGDTLDLLTADKTQVRIRLAGIDAPEKRQAFGNVAKQALSELTFGKPVAVQWSKTDRYGRVVGRVVVQGADVNLLMIQRGLAWHYKAYAKEQSSPDRERYAAAEERARASHLGLWRDPYPIPPWEFRRPHSPLGTNAGGPKQAVN